MHTDTSRSRFRTDTSRAGRHRARRIGLGVAVAALLTTAAACGSSGSAAKTDTTASTTVASAAGGFDPTELAGVTTTLKGSGSSFQQNFNMAAIDLLATVAPGVKISYAGGGSGQGKSDLADGVVDFAGTDSLIKPEDLVNYDGTVLYFPTVVAPITISYSLDGVDTLQLDGPTLAKIFTARVTTWDDPTIAALNPDQDLPSTPITVCRRADASGTTTNFSKFLVSAGGPDWTLGSSDSLDWPTGTQGAQGNGGVAACIAKSAGTIGYVDFSDAKAQNLSFAAIENASGAFVEASLAGASAAAAGAEVADDLTYDPIDAPGADAYPITSPTWVIVLETQTDATKAKALRGFLHFLLTDGQDPSFTASLNYAPLPSEIAAAAIEQLDRIGAG